MFNWLEEFPCQKSSISSLRAYVKYLKKATSKPIRAVPYATGPRQTQPAEPYAAATNLTIPRLPHRALPRDAVPYRSLPRLPCRTVP